jgi:hypothetical protein
MKNDGAHPFLLFASSVLAWLLLTACTLGLVWPLLGVAWLLLRASRATRLARWRDEGIAVGPLQLPRVHLCLLHCCARLGLRAPPRVYLLPRHALAAPRAWRVRGHDYLMLPVEALAVLERGGDDALRFYVGRELARFMPPRPAWSGWLPWPGAWYMRAQVYRCDRLGLDCCVEERASEAACRVLALLALGERNADAVDIGAWIAQPEHGGGFWRSLRELAADRPPLRRRMETLRGDAASSAHHPLAWPLAILLPRRGRSVRGCLFLAAYAGVACAVLLALAQGPVAERRRAEEHLRLDSAYQLGLAAANNVGAYLARENHLPPSVAAAGFDLGSNGVVEAIDIGGDGALVVRLGPPLRGQRLYLAPWRREGALRWRCHGVAGAAPALLPPACRGGPEPLTIQLADTPAHY